MEHEKIKDGKLPLGLIKQATLKLDSFMSDLNEIKDDPDLDDDDRATFETIRDISATMLAHIVNIVSKEIGEEEFMNEEIMMDKIEHIPFEEWDNVLDEYCDI